MLVQLEADLTLIEFDIARRLLLSTPYDIEPKKSKKKKKKQKKGKGNVSQDTRLPSDDKHVLTTKAPRQ